MPDARLQRTRESLPEGYQFGDARQMKKLAFYELAYKMTYPSEHDNGWVRTKRQQELLTCVEKR